MKFDDHYALIKEQIRKTEVPLLIGLSTLEKQSIPNNVSRKILNKLKTDPDIAYYLSLSRSRYKSAVFKASSPEDKLCMIGKFKMFDMNENEERYISSIMKEHYMDEVDDIYKRTELIFQACLIADKLKQKHGDNWFDLDIDTISNLLCIGRPTVCKIVADLLGNNILLKKGRQYKVISSNCSFVKETEEESYKANSYFNDDAYCKELSEISDKIAEHTMIISELVEKQKEIAYKFIDDMENKKEKFVNDCIMEKANV